MKAAATRTAAAPAAKPAAPRAPPAKPAAPAARPQAAASAAPSKVQIVPKTGGKRSDDYYRAFQVLYVDQHTRDVVLRFHKTDIVRITPKGDVILYNGGFYTATTLYSINDALYPMDMELTSRGSANSKGWVINDSHGYSIPYTHNVVIPARKPEDKDRGQWVLEAYGNPDPAPATAGRAPAVPTTSTAAPAAAAPRAQPSMTGPAANGGAVSSSGSAARAAPAAAAPAANASAWPTPAGAAGAPRPAAAPAASVSAYAAAAARGTGQQAPAAAAAAAAAPAGAQARPAGWAATSGAPPPGYAAGNGVAAGTAAAPAAGRQPPGFAQQASAAAKPQAAAAQPQAAAADQLAAQTAHLQLEEDGTDHDMSCVVCMEHFRDTVLVPCGHMVLCSGCCKDIVSKDNLCPVCRVSISEHCQIRM